MDKKKYINQDKPVYISYAWGEDLEIDVNKLCELMDANGIFFKRDKAKGENSLCPYRYNIIDAEKEIGKGKAIIVVISDRYIKSLNCMYEWHCICKTGNIAERVFPIVLPGTKLREEWRYNSFHKHFEERLQEISDKEVKSSANAIENKLLDNNGYLKDLEKLRNHLIEHNIPDLESLREDDYSIIIQQLKEYITKIQDSKKEENPEEKKEVFSAPSFKFATQSNLVGRDNMVEKLHDLVSKNSFSNLYGFGGSGKTSLTYLFLQKYRSEFNQVAYIVVNNDIKADFVSQINDTIHLFKPKEDERNGSRDIQDVMKNAVRERENPYQYQAVISYLESNYKSDKPNLLIIDINNVPDGDIAKFGDDLANNTLSSNKIYPDGWKYLIVSREICKSLAKMNLNKNESQNTVFLKELFLKNAGDQYKDFSEEEFAELFETIYYSPLLAEQLGIFLQDLPKKSVTQIGEILHKDSFKKEKRTGITSQNRSSKEEKTIIGFLRNIIVFDDLKEKEKTLLKHFVLWPTDYIPKNVIMDLLKGLFDEEELENVLIPLVKRRIIAVHEVDGISSYKLHGLVAESLREQIDISNEDYKKYLVNIDRIIEYGYYEFLPYVDCIGHSMCEYDICGSDWSLFNIALKFQDTFVIPFYAVLLYKKVISMIENVHTGIWSRNRLAMAYNNLANMQMSSLDYPSVEAYYNKAIGIWEKMPQDNLEYQNNLANVYNHYAILQSRRKDYISAEASYKKAIEICKKLPQDNDDYQHTLALPYNNLANLQANYLNDYISAEKNYKNAINIVEGLKDNHKYQDHLAKMYKAFADLQADHLKDSISAEANYKKAIGILEQIPGFNPGYQNDLAGSYRNLAILQENCLGDYESAKSNYEKALAIREKLPKDNPGYQNDLAGSYTNLAILQKTVLGITNRRNQTMKKR